MGVNVNAKALAEKQPITILWYLTVGVGAKEELCKRGGRGAHGQEAVRVISHTIQGNEKGKTFCPSNMQRASSSQLLGREHRILRGKLFVRKGSGLVSSIFPTLKPQLTIDF